MPDFEELMGELLELGINANPTCPFTACILDSSGQILVTTCNAIHISPIYTAENLALHVIASEYDCTPEYPLTLISTSEPDDSSLMSIFWARHQGIHIAEVVFGATRDDIKGVWPDDPNRPISAALENFPSHFRGSLKIHAEILRDECRDAFAEGGELKKSGHAPVKSLELDQYWMTGDWLVDDWDDLLEE